MSETKLVLEEEAAASSERTIVNSSAFESSSPTDLHEGNAIASIEKLGIIPSIRPESSDDALFVAATLAKAGMPIIEIRMGVPRALEIISTLARQSTGTLVGAGRIFDAGTARRCLEAGAKFLSSEIFLPGIVELAAGKNVAVIAGALTPTEIITAWTAGSDFVKVTPCDASGPNYIRSLRGSLPAEVRLVPAGGVNQSTALDFVRVGATALSVGSALIPPEAVWLRQGTRIHEFARRFIHAVKSGRAYTRR